ncbi:MAG: hypothetical protein DCC55_13640 [Chloroflexi bacterium]|nr:MAG: hypothetical protein DCC55_13640 [Chloroflexota bacterium]
MQNPSDPIPVTEQRTLHRNHHTVLVRFWRVDDSEPWRATLVYPAGEVTKHFTSVSKLFAHLWDMLETSP